MTTYGSIGSGTWRREASVASIASIALPMIMCVSVLDMVRVQVVPFQYPISDSLSLGLCESLTDGVVHSSSIEISEGS